MASLIGSSSMAVRGLRFPATTVSGRRGVRCAATFAGDNYYKTLSVRPDATEKEVKKAFRKLALKYHPDVCKGKQCAVQFNQINHAYEMILDDLRRPEEQQEEEVYDNTYAYAHEDDSADEWLGCEAAFAFSGGRSESVYIYY